MMIDIIIQKKNYCMVVDIIIKKELFYDDRYHQKDRTIVDDDRYHKKLKTRFVVMMIDIIIKH